MEYIMKKLLLGILAISCSSAFAMTKVDFSKSNYSCNKIAVTPNSSESDLLNNCRHATIVEHEENTAGRTFRGPGGGAAMTQNSDPYDEINLDKVKFYTDDHSYMVCYYKDYVFVKCKVRPPKATKTTTSASINTNSSAAK
jgi:hypothetical protein